MSMRGALRVDPRRANHFEDLGIKDVVLNALPNHIKEPWPIQKKMLALNSSGLSMFARSLPNTGKSTSAMLGMLSTPKQDRDNITNLVLVPTPSLADQYYETMTRIVGVDQYFQVLYRNGAPNIAADEAQHAQLLKKRRESQVPHTLIATPTRVLDYLGADPDLLPLSHLRQLVVDELDEFRHSNPEKKTTLEVLLEYLYTANGPRAPLTTLLTSDMTTKSLEFSTLPQLLDQQAAKRYIYDVSEAATKQWDGEVRFYDRRGIPIKDSESLGGRAETRAPTNTSNLANLVRRMWQGEGLVICPNATSVMQIQEELRTLQIPVMHRGEIAGLNIEDLSVMYVLGMPSDSELNKLKWMLRGSHKTLHIARI